MKRIVSSIIVAVAIWAGSTAFVGTKMEENLQNQIENSNKLHASNGIVYKMNNYEKSFLNSTAEIEVNFTDPAILELIQDSIKLPMVIKYNIEHGPLFLKNGLGFGAARTHQEILLSSLLTQEAKKEFLTLIKDDIIIRSDIDISFTKNASYIISTNEVNINDDGKSFYMTPLKMKGNHNLETFKGDTKLNIDSLKFQEEGTQNGLTLQNLDLNIDIDEFIEKALMVGAIDLSIENLTIKDDNDPQLKNVNIATNLHMVSKKDSDTTISTEFNGDIDFKDTKLPQNLPNLKNIHAKMNMNYIGIKGMLEFQKASKEMQEAQSQIFTKMQSNTGEEEMQKIVEEFGALQQNMIEKIVHSLNNMLVKDKTLIEYGLGMQTKDNKKSSANAIIGYTGDIEFNDSIEEIAMKVQQQALNLVNLDVKLVLNNEHIKTLPNSEILKQQIQMGVAQGFVKEENGKYILNGYYKNQELIINDNNLTATILPFLMMATQGGGF
jgi:hypothetical protein